MHRNKFGSEYYTLIGGHVELGEGLEKALLREIHEETKLHVANPRLVYIEESSAPYGTQYIYLCDYIEGVPVLHEKSDEAAIGKAGQNVYTPMWLPLSKLNDVTFRTEKLKKKILRHVKVGFPDKPQEFRSNIEQ